MKKTITSLALLASLTASASPRSVDDAMNIARNFLKHVPELRAKAQSDLTLSPAITAKVKNRIGSDNASPEYFIFNLENENGFIVVSGDDRFAPVLGYSHSGNITDNTEMPEGLQYWLSFLSAEMNAAIESGYKAHAKSSAASYKESVAPLLTTKWDQGRPYNNKIPNYATGCVATGTAQVMNFWKYPAHGIGSHTNGYFPQYSADFENTTYDWVNMKDEYGGKYDTQAEVEAVSTLMYQLGVATDMRWAKASEGSGTPNMYAGHALINYFGYNKNLYAEERDCLSLGAWKALIIDQLQTGHPLCYAGMGRNAGEAGHFFVLDGYDAENGLFHFNWGWSGLYDGYFNISALEPGTGGTGAGSGNFNYDQQVFINVQPTETGEYVAHFDAKEILPPENTHKSKVLISVDNLQNNAINFKGNAGLALYNAEGTLIKIIPSGNGFPAGLNPGSSMNILYSFDFNLSSVDDGKYTVCLAAIDDKNPDKPYPIRAKYGNATYFTMNVSDGIVSFTGNKSDFYLADSGEPAIENATEANTLYENKVSTFIISIKNTGTTAFFDEVGICIKKSRDTNPQYITVPCSLAPGEEKTVTFSGKVIRTPGTYNMYTCYGDNGEYTTLDHSVSLTIKDEASSIASANTDDANAPIYSVTGIRIAPSTSLQKGLYIINGKKTYIK